MDARPDCGAAYIDGERRMVVAGWIWANHSIAV